MSYLLFQLSCTKFKLKVHSATGTLGFMVFLLALGDVLIFREAFF
jgi:hypothetical protein